MLIHRAIEPGKRRQMLADFHLLLSGLLEEPFSYDEFHIAADDEQLFETVLHPTQTIGDKSKARTVENGFLGLDHGIGHFMLFEVDSEARAPAPPIPKSPQTSSAASDRKSAPLPSSRQAG